MIGGSDKKQKTIASVTKSFLPLYPNFKQLELPGRLMAGQLVLVQ